MGAYTGNGVLVSMTKSGSGSGFSWPDGTAQQVKKLITTKVTKFPGVSSTFLNNLQAEYTMNTGYRGWWEGSTNTGMHWVEVLVPDYGGSQTSYHLQQIADSNLYECLKTETTIAASLTNNVVRI